MDLDLKGKKAFVCGSTQGIGKAIAMELASLGATVVLLARNAEALENVRLELPVVGDVVHQTICADFDNPDELKAKVDGYLRENEGIDILVNNTGGPAAGAIIEASTEAFSQAFSRHVICNQILAQAVVPYMKGKNYGRIINIISTSVKEAIPGLGVSNTIRAAVANWAKTLASELGAWGITVNNVLPGYTKTGRLDSLIRTKADKVGVTVAELEEVMIGQIPAKRFGNAAEVANAVAFLAAPAAAYINGVNLPVDGGRTGCL